MPVHQFTKSATLQFHQCDPGGIMFFANAYVLAHDAYESFIKYLGFSWHEWFENPVWAVPIRHSSCEYFRPLRPGQEVTISVGIDRLGETSFTAKYTVKQNDQIHMEVQLVHTFIHKEKIKSTPIPSEIRERLKSFCS